jgi:hypothetical protein
MNAQVLADPFGHLLWVSAALPGAVYHSGPPRAREPRSIVSGG